MRAQSAPVHLECNVIIPLGVEVDALRPMVELLKLMPQDLDVLRHSFECSSDRYDAFVVLFGCFFLSHLTIAPSQLYLMAVVLTKFGIVDQSLFQLKALIDSPLTSAHALVSLMSTSAPAVAAVPETALSLAPIDENPKLQLKLVKQSEEKTVYHKILKPYPTLEILGADRPEVSDSFGWLLYCLVFVSPPLTCSKRTKELKVQAELYKYTEHPSDADEQLPYLEGERVVPFKPGR